MKKKDIDIKSAKIEELTGMANERKAELAKLKFRHAMGQLEKTDGLGKLRKEIARINTSVREKELAKVKNAKAN